MATTKTRIYLNDSQRSLAEENHNLIYGFLSKHSLEEEYWYDLLAIGLCRAAGTFDESKGYNFSTYAFCIMERLMQTEYSRLAKTKRIPNELISSLDELRHNSEGDDYALYHLIASPEQVEDIAILRNLLNQFRETLSKRRKLIFELYSQGWDTAEIAEYLETTPASIWETRRVLRNDFAKWRCN